MPLTGPFAYDSRPQLKILINDVDQPIPTNIGVMRNCIRPIFTLSTSGTIHVQTDVDRTYTLGDLFLIWGNTYGVQFATFNKDQIFTYMKDADHNITLTTYYLGRSFPDNRFQDYPLPTDANTESNPYHIVITYG